MTPSRPYLLRALHEWIVDNGLTPHIMVDASTEGVRVPREFVEDDKIVFNISPSAAKHLQLRNDAVEFDARFGGQPMSVHVPIRSVLAVYARENGKGMVFTEEEDLQPPPESPEPTPPKRPSLKVVK